MKHKPVFLLAVLPIVLLTSCAGSEPPTASQSTLPAWGQAPFEGTVLPTRYVDRLLDSVSTSSDAPTVRYGTGVGIKTVTEFGPVYGHGGWVPGYVSSLRHYPDYSATLFGNRRVNYRRVNADD